MNVEYATCEDCGESSPMVCGFCLRCPKCESPECEWFGLSYEQTAAKLEVRILVFTFRGQQYRVNEQGHINANGIGHYSTNWIFLGGSSQHWHNRITVTLQRAFEHPEQLNGCLGWDKDHGIVRQWGGMWNSKLPRIEHARIETEVSA